MMNKSYTGTYGVLKNNSLSSDKIIHSDDIFKYENFNKILVIQCQFYRGRY